MKTATRSIAFTFVSALLLGATLAAPARAADKSYQVTGPVLEVTDTTVTVQKGKEKWQLARNKDTKVTGDLKVGAKVTIMYTMTATSIEAKGGDAKADAKSGTKAAGKDAKLAEAPAKK
jgi:cytochrome c1